MSLLSVPRVHSRDAARHLGKRVFALVDGRLSRDEAFAAMEHLDGCHDCRAAWDDLRRDRDAIRTSGTGIDMTFARTLLDRDRIAEIAKDEPRHHAKAARGRGVRVHAVFIGTVVGVGTLVGVLWLLGAPREVGVAEASTRAAIGGDRIQFFTAAELLAGAAATPWITPQWRDAGISPVDSSVVATADRGDIMITRMVVDLSMVTVVEQEGRIAPEVFETAESTTVGSRAVYVVTEDPLLVMWESGTYVLGAGCTCEWDVVETVVAAYPDVDQPSEWSRVGDGLGVVVDAVDGT